MKKMRRLIPAIAMLLVSAVMLSTASFAWFTMNDNVTASGMQIQAKSTGSLIISDAPLTNLSTKTSLDMNVTTAATIKPTTWVGPTTNTDEQGATTTTPGAWSVASSANGAVDPVTGKTDLALVAIQNLTTVKADYFVDKEVYIGSAGDAMNNQAISINLSTIAGADELASKAYAVALYVLNKGETGWADNAAVDNTAEPDAILYADTLKTNANDAFTRNAIILKGAPIYEEDGTTPAVDAQGNPCYEGYDIPSIIGVEGNDAQGNAITTGLKVVLRFFVDGNLDALAENGVKATKPYATYEFVKLGASYTTINAAGETVSATASKVFAAGTTYYAKAADGSYTVVNTSQLDSNAQADMTTAPGYPTDGWYIRVANYSQVEFKYVNSDEVPTTGTALSVSFSVSQLAQPVEE